MWKPKEIYWDQRSRLKWLKWGDCDSKFFHATTVQRRDRNRLHRIKDENGEWVEGQEDIFTAVLEHFWEVYKADHCENFAEYLQTIPRKITMEMNTALIHGSSYK